MTMKKSMRHQACQAEFLSRLNFIILYIPDKKNQKTDSLIYCQNDLFSNNNNDWQQHLLPTLLSEKRLEIILIEEEENITIIE